MGEKGNASMTVAFKFQKKISEVTEDSPSSTAHGYTIWFFTDDIIL